MAINYVYTTFSQLPIANSLDICSSNYYLIGYDTSTFRETRINLADTIVPVINKIESCYENIQDILSGSTIFGELSTSIYQNTSDIKEISSNIGKLPIHDENNNNVVYIGYTDTHTNNGTQQLQINYPTGVHMFNSLNVGNLYYDTDINVNGGLGWYVNAISGSDTDIVTCLWHYKYASGHTVKNAIKITKSSYLSQFADVVGTNAPILNAVLTKQNNTTTTLSITATKPISIKNPNGTYTSYDNLYTFTVSAALTSGLTTNPNTPSDITQNNGKWSYNTSTSAVTYDEGFNIDLGVNRKESDNIIQSDTVDVIVSDVKSPCAFDVITNDFNTLKDKNSTILSSILSTFTIEELSSYYITYQNNVHYTDCLQIVKYEGNVLSVRLSNRYYTNVQPYTLCQIFYTETSTDINRPQDTSIRFTSRPDLGVVQLFPVNLVEGRANIAAGDAAHAEGKYTRVFDDFAHAEGANCVAGTYAAHAEGRYVSAFGEAAHGEGWYTIATHSGQHVQGKYNEIDVDGKYADIIGWGSGEGSGRRNIATVDTVGNAWYRTSVSTPLISTTTVEANTLKVNKLAIPLQVVNVSINSGGQYVCEINKSNGYETMYNLGILDTATGFINVYLHPSYYTTLSSNNYKLLIHADTTNTSTNIGFGSTTKPGINGFKLSISDSVDINTYSYSSSPAPSIKLPKGHRYIIEILYLSDGTWFINSITKFNTII